MALDVLVNATSGTVTSGGTTAPAAGTVEQWTVTQTTWPSIASPSTQTRLIDKADVGKTSGYEVMLLQNIAATSLTTALVSGTAYTSLAVEALPQAMNSGDTIVLGVGATTQNVVLSAGAAAGAVSLAVTSFTASAAFAIGTPVTDLTTPGANLNGSVWTVERGVEGTTPYAHAASWTVVPSATGAGFDGRFSRGAWNSGVAAGGFVGLPAVNGSSVAAGGQTLTTGDLWLMPLYLPPGVPSIKSIAYSPGNGVSGNVRLGLYADNGEAYPGALLIDTGPVAIGASAPTTVVLATPVEIAGLVWVGLVGQSGTTVINGYSQLNAQSLVGGGSASQALNNQMLCSYLLTGVTGALPGPLTSGATANFGAGSTSNALGVAVGV